MISMKRWGLILLSMLCSELAAEPSADVRTWTPQQKLALLSGISDKETADTAAELINSDSTFFFTLEQAEDESVSEITEKLRRKYYFCSEALAAALDDDSPGAAEKPQAVTPGILAELEDRVRRALPLVPEKLRAGISGGPGFSPETAWVFTRPYDPDWQYRDFECYFAPQALIGGANQAPVFMEARTELRQGRTYHVSTVVVFHRQRKHEVDIWVDITDSPAAADGGASDSPMSQEERDNAHLIRSQHMLDILSKVHDHSSADAAADYLWDMNSAALDFDFLHTADLPQQEDAINKLQQELRQRRYYGSELLASYLGRPHDAYEAQPLTHEAAQELESLMRQQLAKAAEPEIQHLAGGPGFTPQTAWRNPAHLSIERLRQSVFHHDTLLDTLIMRGEAFDYLSGGTSYGILNGRYYEQHQVEWLHHGKLFHFSVWLDCSDGKYIPTEEELNREEAQYTVDLQHNINILESLLNDSTASEAAAQRQMLKELITPSKRKFCNVFEISPQEEKWYELLAQARKKGLVPALKSAETGREIQQAHETKLERYTQALCRMLPGVNNRSGATAAARELYQLGGRDIFSHEGLLQNAPLSQEINTTADHLRRIREADYFGSMDLAEILIERIGPCGNPGDANQTP